MTHQASDALGDSGICGALRRLFDIYQDQQWNKIIKRETYAGTSRFGSGQSCAKWSRLPQLKHGCGFTGIGFACC